MKKIILYMILGFFLLGASGCAVSDFDRSADFRSYKTFAWGQSEIDVDNPVYDSDLIRDRIRRAVENEFAKRGIVKDKGDPDFIVQFHTYTEDKERTTYNGPYSYRYFPYAFYPFAFGWGYPYHWMSPAHTTEYTEGTLILDINDARSGELVWRGSVSGDVEDASRLRKQIDKGIKAIMKKYPVSPDDPLRLGTDSNVIS